MYLTLHFGIRYLLYLQYLIVITYFLSQIGSKNISDSFDKLSNKKNSLWVQICSHRIQVEGNKYSCDTNHIDMPTMGKKKAECDRYSKKTFCKLLLVTFMLKPSKKCFP